MSREDHEALRAHLSRYGIPVPGDEPEDKKIEQRQQKLKVIKHPSTLSRRAAISEQEDLYWPLRRRG